MRRYGRIKLEMQPLLFICIHGNEDAVCNCERIRRSKIRQEKYIFAAILKINSFGADGICFRSTFIFRSAESFNIKVALNYKPRCKHEPDLVA
jgi:hypothetical protein